MVVVSFIGGALQEEARGPGEDHRPVASHWQTLSHNVVSITPRNERDSNSTLVVIGTDCIGNCKSNYHILYVSLFLLFLNTTNENIVEMNISISNLKS